MKQFIVDLLLVVLLMSTSMASVERFARKTATVASPSDPFGFDPSCPCIDSSQHLLLASNCKRIETNETLSSPGIRVMGHCYPTNYGADFCSTFDEVADPLCQEQDPPAYCHNPWCFVDADKCRYSEKLFHKSSFQDEAGFQGLYYSYSTCNSSAKDWLDFETIEVFDRRNTSLVVALPVIFWPVHFKESATGEVATPDGPEAYDDSVPWKGLFIDYFDAVVANSNIVGVKYVHRSRGSKQYGIDSIFTQTVADVEAGVADLSTSMYWVTPERLKFTPFTVPIITDEFKLWIKQPDMEEDASLVDNARKIFSPFSSDLWLLIASTILLYAILCPVVELGDFWEDSNVSSGQEGSEKGQVPTKKRIVSATGVLADSLNSSLMHFFAGTIDNDVLNNNAATKILNLGFAFVLFLVITAYTANLAAFMVITNNRLLTVSSVEEAIAANMVICASSPMRQDLETLYPSAKWLFVHSDMSMFEAYDQGRCGALVQGSIDARALPHVAQMYCDRELVRVGHVIAKKPVAFPARKDIVAGISHFLQEAESRGVTFGKYLDTIELACSQDVDLGWKDGSDLAVLTSENMALPLTTLGICCLVSAILHCFSLIRKKKAKRVIPKCKHLDDASTKSDFPLDSFEMESCDFSIDGGGALPRVESETSFQNKLHRRLKRSLHSKPRVLGPRREQAPSLIYHNPRSSLETVMCEIMAQHQLELLQQLRQLQQEAGNEV